MRGYVIKRLLQMIPLVLGVTIIVFSILHFAPGSPLLAMVDPLTTTPAEIAEAERQLGLDQPVPVQYVRWLGQMLRGNLGYSFLTGRSVSDLILRRLSPTLVLSLTAMMISYLIALPIGIASALRRYSFMDRVTTTLSLGGISVPAFFLALLFVYFFGLRLNLFPTSGYGTLGGTATGLALWLDRLPYLIMPAFVLSITPMAGIVRYVRSSMMDTLSEDYIRTARSKGLSERTVIYKHALRNSLIPVITLLGLRLPEIFGGAYVIEYIFDWPGMGTLAIQSVHNREYSIVMSITLVTASLVMIGNLMADVMYAVADPRIRLDE